MNHYYLKLKIQASCADSTQLTSTFTVNRNGVPLENNGEVFWQGYDFENMLIDSYDSISKTGTAYWAF
ncbi:MAG: hypothetical protein IPM74_15965 [Crocinitomicaceae bacterium]|nr:hypothetical protein [Crocinitomicaceae bacterium]